MNYAQKITKCIHRFTHVGVQGNFNYNRVRFLQFTNITALALTLIGSSGLVIFIKEVTCNSDANIIQAMVSGLLIISALLVIYLNHLGHYKYAKYLLVFSPTLALAILSFTLQQASGIDFYYTLAPIGLFLFVGLNGYAYFLIFLIYVLMLFSNFYQNNYGPLYPMAEFLIPMNYTVSLSNTFLVVTFLTYYLIRTNQNMEAKLVTLMETDRLTGLHNRHKYSEFSEEQYQEAILHNNSISVIIFDLDFFKSYNDTYGHLAGDDALVKAASVLKANIQRKTDLIARFGGEEFVAVLMNTSLEDAHHLAEIILGDIENLAVAHSGSNHKVMTCSAGIATTNPQRDSVYIDLFTHADNNLYQAKKQGRNKVVSFEI